MFFVTSYFFVSLCRPLLSTGWCYLKMQPEPFTEFVQRLTWGELHSFTHRVSVSVTSIKIIYNFCFHFMEICEQHLFSYLACHQLILSCKVFFKSLCSSVRFTIFLCTFSIYLHPKFLCTVKHMKTLKTWWHCATERKQQMDLRPHSVKLQYQLKEIHVGKKPAKKTIFRNNIIW